ncbi:MAG: TlpA disulfide reductase family protein [Bacteroidales bacterium]|nr:TlpA disulfide reductase family protein [Bacteroidales bacterium]
MKKIFLLLFLVSAFQLSSQNVIIKGKAKSFEGEKVKLNVYSNQISYREKTIAMAVVDKESNFILKANISEIVFANIRISNFNGAIYLEPVRIYEIIFPPKDSLVKETESIENSILPQEVYISIMNNDSTELNYQIQKFNILYNNFMAENKSRFIYFTPKNKSFVDTLKKRIKYTFGNPKSKYLSAYIEYRVAGLEQMNSLMSRKKLANKYFTGRPVLNENIEYMYFFNQFFVKYFSNFTTSGKYEEILNEINMNKSYTGMVRVLSFDSLLLINDTLKELILLKGLYEAYNDPVFEKKSVVEVIKALAKQSIIKKNTEVAKDFISALEKLAPGTKAPEFSLYNVNKKLIELDDFEGKYVYIGFWTTWSVPSLQEIQMFSDLQKELKDTVEFIGICADKKSENFESYVKKQKFDWNALYYGNQPEVIENYSVIGFPTFILIDRQGRIMESNVKKPSEGFHDYIHTIIEKEKQKKKEEDKLKKNPKNNIYH